MPVLPGNGGERDGGGDERGSGAGDVGGETFAAGIHGGHDEVVGGAVSQPAIDVGGGGDAADDDGVRPTCGRGAFDGVTGSSGRRGPIERRLAAAGQGGQATRRDGNSRGFIIIDLLQVSD